MPTKAGLLRGPTSGPLRPGSLDQVAPDFRAVEKALRPVADGRAVDRQRVELRREQDGVRVALLEEALEALVLARVDVVGDLAQQRLEFRCTDVEEETQ